ncbi:NigD1/NigD2 family lipoprotein [Carboxylicivirga caseinilyticus]|uniref:NigD1/NigD2 family lipoprotein n=1 Tax=Carboxylicivirga caseinilyticus TaxID=3417572 RepID=UPI003D33DBA8|nr:hypothetical protein [Marinilabiliaceae bacterium A049]
MKFRSRFFILLTSLFVMLSSCMKEMDTVPYTYRLLCVTSMYGDYYMFTSDSGDRFITQTLPSQYEFEEDKRVLIEFSSYEESDEDVLDYEYFVVLSSVTDITTKDIIFINEENKDTLGYDGVQINNLYAVGNYLNVDFTFWASGSKSHYFNTSYDYDLQTSNDTIVLTFHHKDNDDIWRYSYSGFLSFDLRSLQEDQLERPYVLTLLGTNTQGSEFKASIDVE